MIGLMMTAEEWQRGHAITKRYCDAVPLSDEHINEWFSALFDSLADGLPGLAGLGPLKTAKYSLIAQRAVNSDELVYDESAMRLCVRAWLAGRGIATTDEPPKDAA